MTITTDAPAAPASPNRPEIATYEPSGWDLSELLPDGRKETITERFEDLESRVAAFEGHREALDGIASARDTGRLLEVLAAYEDIVERSWVVIGYAQLRFSEDTQSREALALRNRVDEVLTGLHNRILFFGLWWRSLSDDDAPALLPARESHPDEHHYLDEMRRFAPYTLDEDREKLINLKDANGVEGLLTLYAMLTNRLEFEIEVEGETRTLTRDALMQLRLLARPGDAARRPTGSSTGSTATTPRSSASSTSTGCRDWHTENVELRGHGLADPGPQPVPTTCPTRRSTPCSRSAASSGSLFQRYFRLKAGWLGHGPPAPLRPLRAGRRLRPRDPLRRGAPRLVLDTFRGFHPRFAEMAERVFAEGHVDSEVRKGKRGGAMCSTVLPHLTPWVLVNYTGRLRDVATLAHELGHAIHSMLAADHSALTQQAVPAAGGDRLGVRRDPGHRAAAGARVATPSPGGRSWSSSSTTSTPRCCARATSCSSSATPTRRSAPAARIEELEALYQANLAEQFGDAVEVSDEFRYEWLSIPHIYNTPFYCYAYSFGQLLVLALYRRYQREGEAFKPGYLRLLAHGGAARPEEVLREAGIDIRDAAFWRGGFQVVEELVEELEAL